MIENRGKLRIFAEHFDQPWHTTGIKSNSRYRLCRKEIGMRRWNRTKLLSDEISDLAVLQGCQPIGWEAIGR